MRLPVHSFLGKRYLAFKQDSRYLKHKTKKGGGQFDPESGGHFGPEYPGHFKSELGGQFERNLHKRLVNAIDAYSDEKGYDRKSKIKLKNLIGDYCSECMKQKKEISLSAISALIDPENAEDFLEFAANEKYGVSETIKGDRAVLRRIKYVIYKGDKYTVEFDADLLGKDIFYNSQKNELTFKRIPDDLARQIQ